MFDFSFPELIVILVVALVVIGPERLPKVARTLGHLYGRAQRYVNGVKADIARDMAVEEFRQLQKTVQAEAQAVEQSVKSVAHTVDGQMQQLNIAVTKPLQELQQQSSLPLQAESATEAKPSDTL